MGVAAGIATAAATGDAGTGALVGTAGAVGGATVGGLAGTYAGLPVTEEAWDTYELDPNDPTRHRHRAGHFHRAGRAARDALRGRSVN